MYNRKKFEKDIQQILENFQIKGETRRQIFSQIIVIELVDHQDQQSTEKVIPNDKTSASSENAA